MQFHQCRKQEMKSSISLQHNDVTSCKQRHLIEKTYWCKEVSACYNHRKFGKVSFINEGVLAFSKKVHVFFLDTLYTPYYCLWISVAFVVLCRVCCLWVTDDLLDKNNHRTSCYYCVLTVYLILSSQINAYP